MKQKSQIRKEFLEKRRGLSQSFVEKNSELIARNFIEKYKNYGFAKIMLYSDFEKEPKTDYLANYFKENGCELAYPMIKGDEIIPKIPLTSMQVGRFGILEPSCDDPDASERSLDLIAVPGIAFDRRKNRIGYGKGFYDRFLKKTDALKVALAYSFQVLNDCFEQDASDIPVDVIITESEIIE